MPFAIVGERQSPLAAAKGWTWEDGRVCAGTLHRALEAAGIAPGEQRFLNLWSTPGLGHADLLDQEADVESVRIATSEGYIIVALGHLISRELSRAGITHLFLVHPAARGAIRATGRYQAHVRDVLGAL